ncbi:MAG: hypothetical protein AB7U98_13760 [Candidatus Nitrosocosmicus sp.]
MANPIQMWRAEDGSIHATESEADLRDAAIALEEYFNERVGIDRSVLKRIIEEILDPKSPLVYMKPPRAATPKATAP